MGSHFQDIQQLLVIKDELPAETRNWSPSLDQGDLNPSHIKQEEDTEIMQFGFDPILSIELSQIGLAAALSHF
ncbi:hypothetical protein CHARACLAT_023246 [Characodon lateralis]|uniref:Uncharacterized protein n=1 Tax=Characodon lateralis TaxID=208331 RepID=A0ABU7DKW9_9TELE|nr:hypothetical protein [Characodon lateralis]